MVTPDYIIMFKDLVLESTSKKNHADGEELSQWLKKKSALPPLNTHAMLIEEIEE